VELFGFAAVGYEGRVVAVEVDIRRGIPGMDIVAVSYTHLTLPTKA
jgi:hypothetical protein